MNFAEILKKAKQKKATVAVAMAADQDVLESVRDATKMGIADFILVGDQKEMGRIAKEISYDLSTAKIMDCSDPMDAALKAVELVHNQKANVLMKGFLQTPMLLRAVLNKEIGLRTGSLLSHVAMIDSKAMDHLLFMTDCAMVMYPDLEQKIQLIQNSVKVAEGLGIKQPKVAVLGAVEVVNPKMPATMDAAVLAQMNRRGQIKNCYVDGPLALDNAVNALAAEHKGIKNSSVAGNADILLVPNIECGNILYKTAGYLGGCDCAGMIAGAAAPIVLTSRSDNSYTKLVSIACAVCMETK